ncbi:B-cell receptor CD22-like isoform X2 [Brevipalpus obovatus]|uniref:B-cell receptor CD22-like isoform X2 n=1 Tax=Brevipalpus obovatus TaxID=246614 RepID=UPI003D9F884D
MRIYMIRAPLYGPHFVLLLCQFWIFLFLSLISYSHCAVKKNVDPPIEIKSKLGDKVSLPCEVKCGDAFFVVWSRSDSMKNPHDQWPRIYIHSHETVSKPIGELANRASLNTDRMAANLSINYIETSDEGFYKCEVTYIKEVANCPSVSFVHLQVLQPPKVAMEPRSGIRIVEHSQPAIFHCTYTATPKELISNATKWFKEDKQLDIEDNQDLYRVKNGGVHPTLKILNVTREHRGTYFCEVSNEIGPGYSPYGVKLEVTYPPKVSIRMFPDATRGAMIREDDDVQLFCDVEDGNPLNSSKVRWIKKTNDGSEMIINETTQNELLFTSIDRTSSANYSCTAFNEAGWSPESNVIEIDVKYLPSPAELRQINANYPLKDDQLILECFVHQLGWPQAVEYEWEQDGYRMEYERSSILNISRINLSTRGNYSCAAVSSVGLGQRGYLYISPMASPRFIESLPKINGALYNAPSHSASCRVECEPICSISWYRNNVLINNSSREFIIKETQHPPESEANIFLSIVSTLTWNMTVPLDKYSNPYEISCSSTGNMVGTGVSSSMMFQVEYPPENLTVIPSNMNVVEGNLPEPIKCHSDALPAPSYLWERRGVPIVVSPVLEIPHPITQENGTGNFTCVAYNRHGSVRIDAVISVLHKPSCEISENTIRLEGQERANTLLTCEATANPNTGLVFQWEIGNQTFSLPNSSDFMSTHETRSHIVISPDDRSMFGLWTCSVTNSIGTSECIFYKSAPLVDSRWMMPHLDDKSIILIAASLAIVIVIFILILIIIICRMKRRRAKQESHQIALEVEKPEASSSPSTSSLSNHVIPSKDTDRKIISQVQSMPRRAEHHIMESPSMMQIGKEPYSNDISFNSKMGMFYGLKPHLLPQYENIAQLTDELRRTQSARFIEKELSMIKFGPLERNIVYTDLQITNDDDDDKSHLNRDHIFHTPISSNHVSLHPSNRQTPLCDYAVLNFDQTNSPTSFC